MVSRRRGVQLGRRHGAQSHEEGPGKTTGTDEDFFRIMSKLPKETQDYVPKLIAAAKVGSDPARYGLEP